MVWVPFVVCFRNLYPETVRQCSAVSSAEGRASEVERGTRDLVGFREEDLEVEVLKVEEEEDTLMEEHSFVEVEVVVKIWEPHSSKVPKVVERTREADD